MSKNKTLEQRDADIEMRRKAACIMLPIKTDEEKEAFKVERKKHEGFDELQQKKRKEPQWIECAKNKGINIENLLIGSVPDEDELDRRHIALMKKRIEILEEAEVISNVIRHDDGKITLTINTQLPRELIKHELGKVLGAAPTKRFRAEVLRYLEIYRLRAIGKVIDFPVYIGRKKERVYRQKVKKKSFVEIGRELGITKDAARKSFNRAYELMRGTPYRSWNKKKIEKALLGKDCNTCKDKPSCEELCPDMVSYADQDKPKADLPAWKKTSLDDLDNESEDNLHDE